MSQIELNSFFKIQYDLLIKLGSVTTLNEALTCILDHLLKIEGIDAGGVYIKNKNGNLELVTYRGLSDQFVEQSKCFKRGTAQFELVAKGKPIYTVHKFILPEKDKAKLREKLLAVGIIPIKSKNEIVGSLNLASHDKKEFPKEVRIFVETTALQIGAILSRVIVQEELFRSEEKFRSLIEQSYDGIVLTDKEGRIIEWNSAQEKISGLKKEDVKGKKLQEVLELLQVDLDSQSKILGHKKFFNKPSGNKGATIDTPQIIKMTLANGETRFIHHVPFPIKTKTGVLVGSIMRDVTELRQSEEIRKKFIEIASHELRTPLTVIIGFIELLKNEEYNLPPEKREKHYKIIENNLSRLLNLINDVSDLSKIERGSFQIKREVIDFNTYFDEEMSLLKESYGEDFEYYNLTKRSAMVALDKERFHQVLTNIINNAYKFTDSKNRRVICSYSVGKRFIKVEITDNGVGIHKSDIQKLFIPFVSIPTKFSVQGTGIGLYISREIIVAHGGTIKIHSDGLGKGATVIIKLPLCK